jgi:hypothetical protein
MITRRHPLVHGIALLAILVGQASMQFMPCVEAMPAAMAGMPGAGHDGGGHQHSVPSQPGHPCCACTCPCRADLIRGPDLASMVRALTTPVVRVSAHAGPDLAPAFTHTTTLPPVRAPPAIA